MNTGWGLQPGCLVLWATGMQLHTVLEWPPALTWAPTTELPCRFLMVSSLT